MNTINWVSDYVNSWRKYNYYVATILEKYMTYKFLNGAWWTPIDDNVILGAIPLNNEGHIEALKKEGVGAVLCILEDFELMPTLYFQPVSEADWTKNDVKFMQIRVADSCGVPINELRKCIEFICNNMHNKIKTYVHCKAGRGRSVSVVLCYKVLDYFMKHGNVTLNDMTKLYDELKVLRPEIGLNEQQLAPIREYVCCISSDFVV